MKHVFPFCGVWVCRSVMRHDGDITLQQSGYNSFLTSIFRCGNSSSQFTFSLKSKRPTGKRGGCGVTLEEDQTQILSVWKSDLKGSGLIFSPFPPKFTSFYTVISWL